MKLGYCEAMYRRWSNPIIAPPLGILSRTDWITQRLDAINAAKTDRIRYKLQVARIVGKNTALWLKHKVAWEKAAWSIARESSYLESLAAAKDHPIYFWDAISERDEAYIRGKRDGMIRGSLAATVAAFCVAILSNLFAMFTS